MKTILLVEDTVSLAEEIADILRLEGYHVEVAVNGKQGLHRLAETNPDLIITDLLMPEVDGIEFIRRIKSIAHFISIPIVILSARTSEEDKLAGEQAGANAFLGKPCDISELVAVVRRLINRINTEEGGINCHAGRSIAGEFTDINQLNGREVFSVDLRHQLI